MGVRINTAVRAKQRGLAEPATVLPAMTVATPMIPRVPDVADSAISAV